MRARGSIVVNVKENDTREELRPVSVFASAEEIGPVDLVLVTLKTTANDALAKLLPPLLGPNTAVLTLQNGLGADEQIASIVGAERVLGSLAFIASTRTGAGEVSVFHVGGITLGEFGLVTLGLIALGGSDRHVYLAVDVVFLIVVLDEEPDGKARQSDDRHR